MTFPQIISLFLCLFVLVGRMPAADRGETLAMLRRVADWQLANPSPHRANGWTQAVGHLGFLALATLPDGSKYEEAMLAVGTQLDWKLGKNCRYHADDQAVGQMYLILHARTHRPEMIAETRAVMDDFCVRPGADGDMTIKSANQRWTWCDALFMTPAVLAQLYATTGEQRYLDTLLHEYQRTHDFLYDPTEHLYFRDASYFTKREANGQKVFWGRGNGWVLAGLANTLEALPKGTASREYFVKIFQEMAQRIITLQQPDGLWRASLLDPQSFPLQETSGSALYCFALAWGINHGLLDRAAYLPSVQKAWAALMTCVTPAGRLTHVQPIGADPRSFPEDATEIYGVGAFLMAGAEIYRL